MKMYWLDLETTELDPSTGRILEIAVALADLESPFDHGPIHQRVLGWDDTPRKGLMFGSGTMNDFVRTMHTKNGLLEECKVSSWSVHDVEEQLLTLVPEVSGDDKADARRIERALRRWLLARAYAPARRAVLAPVLRRLGGQIILPVARDAETAEGGGAPSERRHFGVHRARKAVRGVVAQLQLRGPAPANGYGDRRPEGGTVMASAPCKACDGHGFVMVNAHGPQELKCEDCGGTGEIESSEPDAYCVTTSDGGCISKDPRDMHRPKRSL